MIDVVVTVSLGKDVAPVIAALRPLQFQMTEVKEELGIIYGELPEENLVAARALENVDYVEKETPHYF